MLISQKNAQMADLVLAIEAELRHLDLWETTSPPEHALQSTVPFCFDTLEFTQWLQWVFLPKLRELLETGAELPSNSNIIALAEEVLKPLEQDTRKLFALIQRFDELCCE